MKNRLQFHDLAHKFMRITIFQLLMCTVFINVSFGSETNAQDILNKNITLNLEDQPVKTVLNQLEKLSEAQFLYSSSLIQVNRKVNINVNNKPLGEVLNTLLRPLRLNYKLSGKQIILNRTEDNAEEPSPNEQNISGVVRDEKGEAMPGVNIVIKGTAKGIVTDANGQFRINIPSNNAVLVISFVGYEKQEVLVGNKTNLTITLKTYINAMEEVIVVGYGTQTKASLTSAVSTVNAREMVNIPASNLSNILAGRASGVYVQSATGIPGQTSSVRIRAASSWNAAPPLFVIDGVIRDQSAFDALDPSQIESLSILKDASSTAIYGSRASNGVLLVTTKIGKSGKTQVQFTSVAVLNSQPAKQFEYMPLLKSADIVNSLYAPTVKYNDYDKQWIAKNNPDGRIYFNEVYQNPFSQKHSLNVSGGSDNVNYFIGGNYYDEKGFLPNMTSDRYDIRGKVSAKLNKDLTVGVNLNFNNFNRQSIAASLASQTDLSGFYEKLFYLGGGTAPAYIDGKPVDPGWLGGNPIEVMRKGGYVKSNNQQIDALLTAEYKVPFIDGLTVKMLYSNNTVYSFSKSFAQKVTLYKFKPDPNSVAGVFTNEVTGTVESGSPSSAYIENTNGKKTSYQLNGIMTYDKKINEHTINVLAGYEQSEGYYTYSSINKQNFPYYTTDQFAFTSSVAGDTKATGYEAYLPSRMSYIGRINYDYDGKYLASFSARQDGSSNFAPDKRWGFFPSASAAWVISKESFFENLDKKSMIDLLKLRVSYGTTGNDPSFNYLWKELYNASTTSYAVGDPVGNSSMVAYNGISNPNYTWETSKSFNLGMDVNFLKHWNLTAEYWTKNTYDILGKRLLNLPVEFGATYPPENYGKMNAEGFEIEIGYKRAKLFKGFEMNVSANLGLATTKVIQIDAPSNSLPAEDPNGKALNAMVGYNATGILRNQRDVDNLPANYTIFGAKPELGMMNFQDVSGPNGKPDGKIDNYDKIVIAQYGNMGNTAASYNGNGTFGSNNAPISFGLNLNFNYKGFSLDMLWGGLGGYKILYNDPWGRSFPGLVAPTYYDNAWTPQNPDGTAPKIFRSGDPRENGYKVASTYNIYDATFVRLKNVQLSYDLKNLIKGKVGIKSANVFIGATNLLTITGFKYYDPETFSGSSYPVMRTVNTGINFQF